MTTDRFLIGGVGNIFFGDDGFGIEVVRRLCLRKLPEYVKVIDFGLRMFDVACELVKPYDLCVFIDTAARGGVPGSVFVIEPVLGQPLGDGALSQVVQGHALQLDQAFALARNLGEISATVRIIGCEPKRSTLEFASFAALSPPVAAAVEVAVDAAWYLIQSRRERSGDGASPCMS